MYRGSHSRRSTSTTRGSTGTSGSNARYACTKRCAKDDDGSSHVSRHPEVNHGTSVHAPRRSGRRRVFAWRRDDAATLCWDASAAPPLPSTELLDPMPHYQMHSRVLQKKEEVSIREERRRDTYRLPPTHVNMSSTRPPACLGASCAGAAHPAGHCASDPAKSPLSGASVPPAARVAAAATSPDLSLHTAPPAAQAVPISPSHAAVLLKNKRLEECSGEVENEELETACCSRENLEGAEFCERRSVSSADRSVALLGSSLQNAADTSRHIHSAQTHATHAAASSRRSHQKTATAAEKELQRPLATAALSQQEPHQRHRHRTQQEIHTIKQVPLQHRGEQQWQRQQQERLELLTLERLQLQEQPWWQRQQEEELSMHAQQQRGQQQQQSARRRAQHVRHQRQGQIPSSPRRSQNKRHHRRRQGFQQQEKLMRWKQSVGQPTLPAKQPQQHEQLQQEHHQPLQQQQLNKPVPQQEQLSSGPHGADYVEWRPSHSAVKEQRLIPRWSCDESHAGDFTANSVTSGVSLNCAAGGRRCTAAEAAAATARGLSPSQALRAEHHEEARGVRDQQEQQRQEGEELQQQDPWQHQQQEDSLQPQQQQKTWQEQEQQWQQLQQKEESSWEQQQVQHCQEQQYEGEDKRKEQEAHRLLEPQQPQEACQEQPAEWNQRHQQQQRKNPQQQHQLRQQHARGRDALHSRNSPCNRANGKTDATTETPGQQQELTKQKKLESLIRQVLEICTWEQLMVFCCCCAGAAAAALLALLFVE